MPNDMCSPTQDTHIPSDMCSPTHETYIPSDMCSPPQETHITRDMCSPTQETYIPSDMRSPGVSISTDDRLIVSSTLLSEGSYFFPQRRFKQLVQIMLRTKLEMYVTTICSLLVGVNCVAKKFDLNPNLLERKTRPQTPLEN